MTHFKLDGGEVVRSKGRKWHRPLERYRPNTPWALEERERARSRGRGDSPPPLPPPRAPPGNIFHDADVTWSKVTDSARVIQKWWVWRHWYRKEYLPRIPSLEETAARQLASSYVNWIERACSALFFPTAMAHRQYENHLLGWVLCTAHKHEHAHIASTARVEYHTKQELWHRAAYDLYHFLYVSVRCSNGWSEQDKAYMSRNHTGRGGRALFDPKMHPWSQELEIRLEEDAAWTSGPMKDYRTWDFPYGYRRHSI